MIYRNTDGRDKTALLPTSHEKIGLGGGCHWCTEGVFESIKGVIQVNQGWIASTQDNQAYSEAIEVIFDKSMISQHDIINIHLHTHASTSEHSMREKYRSAIYVYDAQQFSQAENSLLSLSEEFNNELITMVLNFSNFRSNKEAYQSYFYTSPTRPFCQTYIHPKLKVLLAKFSEHVNLEKLDLSGININGTG